VFERSEILKYPEVYYFGTAKTKKVQAAAGLSHNAGYDDDNGFYKHVLGDHIAYRYEVLSVLGKGSFGQVLKVLDHKTGAVAGLKLIRNKKRFQQQGLIEIKLLEYIRDNDPHDTTNNLRFHTSFHFRRHLCVVFELLSLNLYDFLQKNDFAGLSLSLVRKVAIQLLNSLRFLHLHNIIHADIKPENILLKDPTKSGIKLIDFGSGCFAPDRKFTYIQSRFYRAPEVILGLPYGLPIDMYSFGCVLAELHTGYPLFPGQDEADQLARQMQVMGLPPRQLLLDASRRNVFFSERPGSSRPGSSTPRGPSPAPSGTQLVPIPVRDSRGRIRKPGSRSLASMLNRPSAEDGFVSFLHGCLAWDPAERFSPDDALSHPWIAEGIDLLRGRATGGQP
jgi:dual specificity tyrosine-phosphorylation-regulated kinase 2/3/4